MTTEPNPLSCPLCGGDNTCAVARGAPVESCWCNGTAINATLLQRMPAPLRNQACVCARCAATATGDNATNATRSEQ